MARSFAAAGEEDQMDNQKQRAEKLRSLHDPSAPLVLLNVWDVASAKAVAATGVSAS